MLDKGGDGLYAADKRAGKSGSELAQAATIGRTYIQEALDLQRTNEEDDELQARGIVGALVLVHGVVARSSLGVVPALKFNSGIDGKGPVKWWKLFVRNFRFGPLARTSYASPALDTTSFPSEQAPARSAELRRLVFARV